MKNLKDDLTTQKTFFGKIEDVKLDYKSGMAYVTVRLPDGSLLGGEYNSEEEDISQNVDLTQLDYKVLKLLSTSEAAIQAGDEVAAVIGSPKYRLVSTKKYGNFIVGPTTFTAHPESVRIGGVFRFNGLLTSTIPSTIISPVSTLILDIPGENMIKILNSTFEEFKSILGI